MVTAAGRGWEAPKPKRRLHPSPPSVLRACSTAASLQAELAAAVAEKDAQVGLPPPALSCGPPLRAHRCQLLNNACMVAPL